MSYPSKKADKNEVQAIKYLLQCSMSSEYRQKKASTKRGHLISQVHNTEVKWSIKLCIVQTKKVCKTLRQKLMKNSNVRQSPIAHDTSLINDTESGVKRRVPKLLLECSWQKLHNEIITSPDDGGLLGAINANKNDVIISNTMLLSLEPPQIRPIKYHHKIMCGCAICNTSKYFQG